MYGRYPYYICKNIRFPTAVLTASGDEGLGS